MPEHDGKHGRGYDKSRFSSTSKNPLAKAGKLMGLLVEGSFYGSPLRRMSSLVDRTQLFRGEGSFTQFACERPLRDPARGGTRRAISDSASKMVSSRSAR